MKLKPHGDRVIVRPIKKEQTKSGIIIPDLVQGETQYGEVLAAGPGPRSPYTGEIAEMNLAVGEEILYAKYAGQELKIDGEDVLVLRETDIIGSVED